MKPNKVYSPIQAGHGQFFTLVILCYKDRSKTYVYKLMSCQETVIAVIT